MAFRGWPVEALEFYEGLAADNSKTYWTENRAVYDQQVLAPMAELLAELNSEFGESKIFRPYRDVRFSPDKTPYKTAIGATIGSGYIQLSADGLGTGSGMWMMAADQLDRYRHAVDNDRTGTELTTIIATIEKSSIDVGGHGSLKTAPKGYSSDHPRIDLLRHKGLVAWKEWPAAAWLGTAAAKKRVVEFLRTTRPLNDWLETNVGSSTAPESRR
jgi:uncharacterized protein (TIGR02453 family)